MELMNYKILEAIKKAKMFRSTIDGRIVIPLFDKENIIVGDDPSFYGTLCLSIAKPNDEFFIIKCYESCDTSDDVDDDNNLAKMIVFHRYALFYDEEVEKALELAKSLVSKDYDAVMSPSISSILNSMFERLFTPEEYRIAKEKLYTLD